MRMDTSTTIQGHQLVTGLRKSNPTRRRTTTLAITCSASELKVTECSRNSLASCHDHNSASILPAIMVVSMATALDAAGAPARLLLIQSGFWARSAPKPRKIPVRIRGLACHDSRQDDAPFDQSALSRASRNWRSCQQPLRVAPAFTEPAPARWQTPFTCQPRRAAPAFRSGIRALAGGHCRVIPRADDKLS